MIFKFTSSFNYFRDIEGILTQIYFYFYWTFWKFTHRSGTLRSSSLWLHWTCFEFMFDVWVRWLIGFYYVLCYVFSFFLVFFVNRIYYSFNIDGKHLDNGIFILIGVNIFTYFCNFSWHFFSILLEVLRLSSKVNLDYIITQNSYIFL